MGIFCQAANTRFGKVFGIFDQDISKNMAHGKTIWQHRSMITFHTLPDDHPDLAHSPLLRAALLTLHYTREHRSIGLTKTMAFKRIFVHWAVQHFDLPGSSAEKMFRYNKVVNEYEFPALELLHFLLVKLRLARHFKGEFRLTTERVNDFETVAIEL